MPVVRVVMALSLRVTTSAASMNPFLPSYKATLADGGQKTSCGGEGHFARDCTEPRKPMGACFNCGQEG